MFTITPVSKRVHYLKLGVYGDYGSGKTRLAGTAAEVESMNDVLFISAESGDLTLGQLPYADKLDVVPVNNYAQFARLYEYLRLHCRSREAKDLKELARLQSIVQGCKPEEIKKPRQYNTVIIDSLSEVQRYCMMQLMGTTLDKVQLDSIPDTPEFKEWGQSAEMIRTLVRAFRDLPMHVIFVIAQKSEQDDLKRYHHTLHLPGKLANDVQGFLDVVGYLAVGNAPPPKEGEEPQAPPRRLYLQPTPYFSAKSRINGTVQFVEDPTIARLLAAK